MARNISRREALELGALSGFALIPLKRLGKKGARPMVEEAQRGDGSVRGYGLPVEIPFVEEENFSYDPAILSMDQFEHLRIEQTPHQLRYFHNRELLTDPNDPYYAMRRRKLKLAPDVAPFTEHTMPGYLPDIKNDPAIMEIRRIQDPVDRMETLLSTLGIETVEMYEPMVAVTHPDVSTEVRYLATKLVEATQLEDLAMQRRASLLGYLLQHPETSDQDRLQIQDKCGILQGFVQDFVQNHKNPIAEEYAMRVVKPYYQPTLNLWPNHPENNYAFDPAYNLFHQMEIDVSGRVVALILHAISVLEGKQSESPLVADIDGMAILNMNDWLSTPYEKRMLSGPRLLDWIQQSFAWKEVSGASFDKLLEYTDRGQVIVNFELVAGNPEAHTGVKLLWRNREAKDLLWSCHSTGQVASYVYYPVSPTENQRTLGMPVYETESPPLVRQFVRTSNR